MSEDSTQKKQFREKVMEETKIDINNAEQKRLARKIWDIPFASSNLHKLTKKELLMLIEEVLIRISFENPAWHELDIKDILFEQKCWLVECLDNDFFNRREQNERNNKQN